MSCKYNYNGKEFDSKEGLYNAIIDKNFKLYKGLTPELEKILDDLADNPTPQRATFIKQLTEKGISEGIAKYFYGVTQQSEFKQVLGFVNEDNKIKGVESTEQFVQNELFPDNSTILLNEDKQMDIQVIDGIPHVQVFAEPIELIYKPLVYKPLETIIGKPVKRDKGLYVHPIFADDEEQAYTYRVLAYVFINVIKHYRKTLGEAKETSEDLKSVIIGTLGKTLINLGYTPNTKQFINFNKLRNAILEEDSKVWRGFKQHLNTYRGYKIIDIEDVLDEEDEIKKDWSDKAQFTLNSKDTVAIEIKELFNSTYKIFDFIPNIIKEGESITNDLSKTFEDRYKNNNTPLGIVDTLQWADYSKEMFNLMEGANSKEEMLHRLYIASNIDTPKHKALLNIWLKLKQDSDLQYLWFRQFKKDHPESVLSLIRTNDEITNHKMILSNQDTFIENTIVNKWLDTVVTAVKSYVELNELEREFHPISDFIHEIDILSDLAKDSTNLTDDYYNKLSTLLTGIGFDITAKELEYIQTQDVNKQGLAKSLLPSMGSAKTFIETYKPNSEFKDYNRLYKLAGIIKIFRFDVNNSTSLNANGNIESANVNPNFVSDWMAKLKNPTTQQATLEALIRIPIMQHDNLLWNEPTNNKLEVDAIINDLSTNEQELVDVIHQGEVNGILNYSLVNGKKVAKRDSNGKLIINTTFLERFKVVNYKGIKNIITNTVDEYDSYDNTMRSYTDIVEFYNNVNSKYKDIGLYPMRCNSDSGWTYKIVNTILPTEHLTKMIYGYSLTEKEQNINRSSIIYKKFLNVLRQDIAEIQQASVLLFGNSKGVVKLTKGKLTVNPKLNLNTLHESYHFNGYNSDGTPKLLDANGYPTGNVFKARSLKLNDGTTINDMVPYFKYGAILSNSYLKQYNDLIYKFVDNIIKETAINARERFEVIKDKLLSTRTDNNSLMFIDDTFDENGKLKKVGSLNLNIFKFALNTYISNAMQGTHWEGTLAEFDLKRGDVVLEYIKRANSSTKLVERANPAIIVDGKLRTAWNTLSINDIHLQDDMLEDKIIRTKQYLIDNNVIDASLDVDVHKLLQTNPANLNSAEAAIYNEIKAYKDYVRSDGVSIITYNEFKNRMKAFGMYQKYKMLFDKIDNGEQLNLNEYNKLIESQKEYYYHRVYDPNTGVYKSKVVKDSKYILIPGYLGSQMLRLHNFMMSAGIDEVQFISATKIRSGQAVTLHEADGNLKDLTDINLVTTIASKIQQQYYEYLGVQQTIHSLELDSDNKLAVQIIKVVWDNIVNHAYYKIDNAPIKGDALFNHFGELFTSQIMQSMNDLLLSFGGKITVKDGKIYHDNENSSIIETKVVEYILEQCIRQGLDSNIIWGLEYTNGLTNVPVAGNMHIDKIKSILESLITNRVIRQVHPGPHSVLVSNAFMDTDRHYVGDAALSGNKQVKFIDRIQNDINAGKRTSKLKAEKWVDGNTTIIKAEVVLSAWNKHFFKEGELIDINNLPEKVRTMIAYYVPYEDKHSTIYLEVVGFVPSQSNQIFIPDAMIPRSGKDFDIDTAYLMSYNTKVDKDGDISVIQYLDKTTPIETRWKAFSKEYIRKNRELLLPFLDAMNDVFEDLTEIFAAKVKYTGDPEILKLAKERNNLYSQIHNEKDKPEPNKTLIKSLYRKANDINTKLLDDGSYPNFIEQIKDRKFDIKRAQEVINKIKEGMINILVDNNLMPSFEQFKTLSVENQNTYAAKQNRMLSSIISVISDPKHFIELEKSNDFGDTQQSAAIIREKLNDTNRSLNVNNYVDAQDLTKNLLQTVNLKGRAVSHKGLVSILSKISAKVDKKYAIQWNHTLEELALPVDQIVDLYGEDNVIFENDGSVTITYSFIGNNLLKNGKNVANTYISSIVSQIVSNILDSVKFPMSSNLNGVTLNAYSIVPTLGVSHRIEYKGQYYNNPFIGIDSFIHQPIIRELTNLINVRSSNTYIGGGKNNEVFELRIKKVTEIYKKYYSNVTADMLFNEATQPAEYKDAVKKLKSFNSNIEKGKTLFFNKENQAFLEMLFKHDFVNNSPNEFSMYDTKPLSLTALNNGFTDTSLQGELYQLSLLNNWVQLDKLRGAFFNAIQVLNQEKRKYSVLGSNTIAARLDKFNDDLTLYVDHNNTKISIYDAIYKLNQYPILSSIYTYVYDKADMLIKPYLISEYPIIKRYLGSLYNEYKIFNPDMQDKISKYFTNQALLRMPILNDILTNKSVEHRILGLANTIPYNQITAETISIDDFTKANLYDKIAIYKIKYPKLVTSNTHILNKINIRNKTSEITRNGYVKIDYISDSNNNEALDSVSKLYYSNEFGKVLVEDIIRYSFLIDGLTFGYNLSKTLPYPILNDYGYSIVIRNLQADLIAMEQEIQSAMSAHADMNLTPYQQQLLLDHYTEESVKRVLFRDSGIETKSDLIRLIHQSNFYNQAFTPVMNITPYMGNINDLYWVKNEVFNSKSGFYNKFAYNDYVRIRSYKSKNLISMNINYSLFETFDKKSYNELISLNLYATDVNGNWVYKDPESIDIRPGNIITIRSPYSKINNESKYVNIEVIDSSEDGLVTGRKTIQNATLVEPLYTRVVLGGEDGVTFYYPISRTLPNKYGETSIPLMQTLISEKQYLMQVIPDVIKSPDVVFDKSVKEAYNKLLDGTLSNKYDVTFSDMDEENVNDELNQNNVIRKEQNVSKAILNNMNTTELLRRSFEAIGDNQITNILDAEFAQQRKILVDELANLNKQSIIAGLTSKLSSTKAFLALFDSTELNSKLIDKDIEYWKDIVENDSSKKEFTDKMFAIKTLHEGFSQFSNLILPYTPTVIANMTEEEAKSAQRINELIQELAQYKGKIDSLNNIRIESTKYYWNLKLRELSSNPEIASQLDDTIKKELENLFEKGYDDMGSINYYLDSMLATSNAPVALIVKDLILNELNRKNNTVSEITKLEQAINVFRKVDAITRGGQPNYEADSKARATKFVETMFDKTAGKLIIEFKHEFVVAYQAEKAKLDQVLIENKDKGGKASFAYIEAEKEFNKWKRNNISQRNTLEYIEADDKINQILLNNPKAREAQQEIIDEKELITQGLANRSNLDTVQIAQLKEIQDRYNKLADERDINGNLKIGEELEIAKTLKEYRDAKAEFYAKYHMPIDNPEFESALELAKKLGPEALANFLEKNTKLTFSQEFFTKYKELSDILYGDTTNEEVSDILKKRDAIIKSHKISDTYPESAVKQIQELEQQRQDVANKDRSERVIKFTSLRDPLVYTPALYDARNAAYAKATGLQAEVIDKLTKQINDILIPIKNDSSLFTDTELKERFDKVYKLMQTLRSETEAVMSVSNLKDDAVEDIDKDDVRKYFKSYYDMDAYNRDRAKIEATHNTELIDAWHRLFTSEVFDDEYIKRIRAAFAQTERRNKEYISTREERDELDMLLKDLRDLNNIINGQEIDQSTPRGKQIAQQIRDRNDKFNRKIKIQAFPKSRNIYTADFWDKVMAPSKRMESNPIYADYLANRERILNDIYETYLVYSNEDGIIDTTNIRLIDLIELGRLNDALSELRKTFNETLDPKDVITKDDEQSEFLREESTVLVNTFEFDNAYAKVKREHADDPDYIKAWLKVNTEIDVESYRKRMEEYEFDVTKSYLQELEDRKKSTVRYEITDDDVRNYLKANSVDLSKEGKVVYASKSVNGELDVKALSKEDFAAIHTYLNGEGKIIEAKGLIGFNDNGELVFRNKDRESSLQKELADYKNARTKYGFTSFYLRDVRDAAEKDSSKLFTLLYNIIQEHIDESVNVNVTEANRTLQTELTRFAKLLFDKLKAGEVDEELAMWFFKTHRLEQEGLIMPRGYYLKIAPNEGATFRPNTRIWGDFVPRNKAKYTDIGAETFRDLAEFVPTKYYREELQRQIDLVGAYDLEHAKGSKTFMEWYTRNHYYDMYTRKYVPTSLWTRLMPKDNKYISTKPNKTFYGYKSFTQNSTKTETKYIDAAKTEAKAKLNQLATVSPTPKYEATKRDMIAKYGINSTEYQTWFANNHYVDRIKGDIKPIKIWTKLTPNDQSYFQYNTPESFWNKSEVKPEYINPNYRENRKGYAMPQDHWKDDRYNAIKDDPMYNYLVDTIPSVLGMHKDWVKETGFIPIVGQFDRSNIDSIKDFFGVSNESGAVELSGSNNQIVHVLQIPFMKNLLMRNGHNPYDLPRRSKSETAIAYEQRVLKSFARNGITKQDGTPYTSYREILDYNNEARKLATEFTISKMQLDPYMFMKAFIGEGLKYRYRKSYEHEMLLSKDLIRNMQFNQRDTLGNRLISKTDSILNRMPTMATMNNEGSRLYNRFDTFINNVFYEVTNKKTNLDKVARVVAVMTSLNFMGFNVPAGIDNFLTSSAMILQEGNAKLFTTTKDLNRAARQYSQSLSDFIGNAKVDTNSTLVGAIMKRLDIMDVYTETGAIMSSATKNTLDKILGASTNVMYFFMNSTEHVVQNTMAISMHHSHRIVNGKIMSFNDFYGDNRLKVIGADLTEEQKADFEQYKTKRLAKYTPHSDDYIDYFGQWLNDNIYRGTNVVKAVEKYKNQAKSAKEDAKKEFEKFPTVYDSMHLVDGRAKFINETSDLTNEYNEFKLRIQGVNQSMFGIYDKIGANVLQASALGALAMQFKKWIKANWNRGWGNRFGKSQYNEFTQIVNSPMYITWLKFVGDPIKRNNPFGKKDTTVLSAMFNILYDYVNLLANFQLHYATLSEVDKANIRKVNTQIGTILIAILAITLLAKGKRDDDDDQPYMTQLGIYQAYRLYGSQLELTPFGWLGASKKMLSSPFASIKATTDMADLAYQILAYPFLDEESRVKQSGMFKGESKIKVAALKASPLRAPFNMTNISALVNYYKMYTPFDINTKESDK